MSGLVEIREKLQHKAVLFQRLFSTPDGVEALAALAEEFERGQLFSSDPLKMAHRLGSRDVVVYIQQLVNYGDKI